MNLKDVLFSSGEFVSEALQAAIEEHCSAEVDEAKNKQKQKDIISAICSLVTYDISDEKIMEVLSEFFGVDSFSEAKEYIKKSRIHYQIIALRKHYTSDGHTNMEFRDFSKKYHLEAKLGSNDKLRYLSPEKLLKEIEKG